MKTAMRLGTRSVLASAKSKPHNGVKTPFNDKIVELVNAPGVGLLKPDPRNLDPLWALVPQ